MKNMIIFLVICIIVFLIGVVAHAEADVERDMFHKLFSSQEDEIQELFADSFLNQLPASEVNRILDNYEDNLGTLEKVEGSGGNYTLYFEGGTAPAQISLNEEQKIIGLWFGEFTVAEDNVEDILSGFEELPGEVGICVIKNDKEKVLGRNEEEPMAVGSAFKLFVLREVYDKINADSSWDDVVMLDNRNTSLSSGILQDWPEGTPVTLKTLSNLMISRSDNTATDHLIEYVGKENIENSMPEDRNVPFLKTVDMFKLKYAADSELQSEYVQGDKDKKREITASLRDVELKEDVIDNNPRLIDKVEWFFTAEELCQIIYKLKDANEIKINSGLVAKDKWHLVGFKGGSEPGVLQFTHLVQKNTDDDVYAVAVTVNDPQENVKEDNVQDLTTRLLSLIGKGEL